MADPLTISFVADTSRAQSAMASLAASVVGNMTSAAVAMSGAAANTNALGGSLAGLQQNFQRVAGVVSADARKISTATVAAATADKASLEGIVKSFVATAAASETAKTSVKTGIAATGAAVSGILAQVPTLNTLLRAFIAYEAAKIIFESVAASIDQARKHLEEFVKIGRDAERVGVGSEFFQRATLSAEKYGLTVEQVAEALKKAREASEIRIGEGKGGTNTSAIDSRLEQNVRAGNLTAGDKALFDNAGNQEGRIRVVLDLIDKLRASGRDVAAFDLAGRFFGSDFEARLREGVDLTNKLREAINSTSATVAGVRIIGEDEIERANQLDAKAKDIANTFATALAPIQRDISTAVLDTYEAFLNVEAVIARVVGIAADLYKQITGVVGQARAFVESIPYIGKVLTAGNVVTFTQEALRAAGAIPEEQQGPPAPIAVRVKPKGSANANPLPSLHGGSPRGGADSLDAVESLINQLEKARDTAKAELDNVAKTNVERERAVALAKAEAAAREDVKRGKRTDPNLDDDERSRVLAAAEAWQTYKDRVVDAQQAQRQAADAARYFSEAAAAALADAVLEGKSFNDILNSITKQIFRSGLQAAFTGQGPLAGLLGTAPTASSGDTVGGIAGLLKGAFSMGGSGPVQGPTTSGATLDTVAGGSFLSMLFEGFRANGGPVQAGRPYTVGEMGREMFVPDRNGSIVPIRSGGAGGGAVSYTGGDTYLTMTPADGVTPAQLSAVLAARDAEAQRTFGQQLAGWRANN